MTRLVHITTLPQTAASFLHGQLAWMRRQGFDITLIASPGPQLGPFAQTEGIRYQTLSMTRSISPTRDGLAILQLARRLRRIAPHIVHAHTPKAGLIGMAAARVARVPVCVYQQHGLRFETLRGSRRALIKSAERFTCGLAHRVFCVSPSLRKVGIREGLYSTKNSTVLGHGSANGLDVEEFVGGEDLRRLRDVTRQRLNIPATARCLGFVGRLVRDKGVMELAAAWRQLRVDFPDLHLLLVGPFEPTDAVPRNVQQQLRDDPRVHLTGLDWNTRGYFAAMDVFTLPTHREGLGHVLLEAGAMSLPVVSCCVTGCVDAVVAGTTGKLVPPRDPEALQNAIATYLRDPALRARDGAAGRVWVKHQFTPQPIWEAVRLEYQRLLRRYAPHLVDQTDHQAEHKIGAAA